MIQDIGKGRFDNQYHPVEPTDSSIVLSYKRATFLGKVEEEVLSLLTYKEAHAAFPEAGVQYLFMIDGNAYFLMDELDETAFPGYAYHPVRTTLRAVKPKENAFAAVVGHQLYDWYRTRKFCPCCGKPMVHDGKERMMKCEACGQMEYPKIMPAVIVGVYHGERLLMSKYAGRGFTNFALIAGFAEIGETIEETVHREVLEETGLHVKNLRFYKSQPWCFTGTLLFGFFCELDGAEDIHIDTEELALANFYEKEDIPEDPGVSLTSEMMQFFKDGKLAQTV